MAVDDRITFYGVSILASTPRLLGLSILSEQPTFKGISILTNNYFSGDILITDPSGNTISGATIDITSTQTHPNNYGGDISGITNSEGIFSATGSSTTGTTVTIEADGYTTYTGPLNSNQFNDGATIVLFEGGKKIWNTNKGNIMFNPNDTILIEIS